MFKNETPQAQQTIRLRISKINTDDYIREPSILPLYLLPQHRDDEQISSSMKNRKQTKKGLMHILHKSLKSVWCRGTELNCRHGDFQSKN